MAWTQSGNIKGASGTPGATGPAGPTGASGASGGTGGVGASGPAGTTTWSGITDKPAVIAAGTDAAAARNVISAEYTANKGVANGYAALDSSGLVPSSQLPSFVDDVVEASTTGGFPATGESGKIYTATSTGLVYRWGGSSYVEISASPGSTDAVPEGSTNLYYTAARADGRITAAVGSTVQAYSATLTTYAGKTAPTGTVVGTTDTQALTNKDLSGASNTFPAFIKRSISTVTSNTTLGAASNTDYVTFANIATPESATKMLLHGNGANNSTTFTDTSMAPFTITRFGDAKISTAQSKFGSSSMLFDGTGDYLTAPSTAGQFGSSAFTVEMWVYPVSRLQSFPCLFSNYTGYGSGSLALFAGHSAGNTARYQLAINGAGFPTIQSTTAITYNAWTHIAVVRNSGVITLYINGTADGTYSTTATLNGTSGSLWIGTTGDDTANGAFNGYIDDFRISTNAAYTANFTAPAAELPDPVTPTLTLPTATGGNVNHYTVKNIHPTESLTIKTTSSQLIDGSATATLAVSSTSRLVSDGSNWRTV